MIILDNTPLLIRETLFDHRASEIRFLTVAVRPWDRDQTGNKAC